MLLRRIGSDCLQLFLVCPARNSDREDFDSGIFCQLCFGQRLVYVRVSIVYQKHKSTNVLPRSTLFEEHLCPGSLQRTCDVSNPTVGFQRPQNFDDAVRIRVVIQVEDDIRSVAELHQSDPYPIRRDRERLHDTGCDPQYSVIPVVVIRLAVDRTT